jgi:anti-sigma B factor antagonist
MEIKQRIVGGVTVLDVFGMMSLGDSVSEVMGATLRELVTAQRLKLVLNLEAVPYIDSTGLGELVRAYSIVRKSGGRIVLCHLTKRLLDLLSITKLLTVWDVYDSVEAAVRSFGEPGLEATCPVCRPLIWTNCPEVRPLLTCSECDVRFSPHLTPAILTSLNPKQKRPTDVTAHVNHLWWITYYENSYGQEAVGVVLGRPTTISISGRLDLWAFDVVERAWEAVPRPRRVIFDTTRVRLFSEMGRARLVELCRARDAENRAVVVVPIAEHSGERIAEQAPTGSGTFSDRDQAIAALGDLDAAAQSMDVTIRVKAALL